MLPEELEIIQGRTFCADVAASPAFSLDKAKFFVPAHAAASEEIADLAQFNISKVLEIAGKIIEICQQPRCFETILQDLFHCYALTMNFEQYVLVGSTVRSYLAWLKDTGKLIVMFENNMLLWQSV